MSWADRVEQVGGSVVTAAVLSVGSAMLWLVRRVMTNQTQIALLQADLAHREKLRGEDREALSEVRDSVKRIEGLMMKGTK